MAKISASALILALFGSAAAWADGFDPVRDQQDFVSLIDGRNLKRTGITLTVTPDGQITGRALGRSVSGAWRWQGGYFCRDLSWGSRDLGPNCQVVQVRGTTVRFTADRGTGATAEFVLQ